MSKDLTLDVRRFADANGQIIEAHHVEDAEDFWFLRNSPWSEEAVRLLTYPSHTEAWVGIDPPLSMLGKKLNVGNYIAKGPAGDFDVFASSVFASTYTEVDS